MPYLNWKQAPVRKNLSERERDPSELRLALAAAEAQALVQALDEVFATVGPELRVDLPDNWILFFKLREGESRLLLAPPEKDEWVSTVALDRVHGESLLRELRALRPGEILDLRALGSVASVSNLHLLIEGI